MTEQTQSPPAVPGAQELSAAEGSRNAEVQATVPPASQTDAPAQGEGGTTPKELELINRATGRQYKSLEDAEKGLRETVSFIGSVGQRASLVEKLAAKIAKENNISVEAATKYISDLAEQQADAVAAEASEAPRNVAPANTARSPQDYQNEHLQQRINELELLRKFPEAETHVDLIRKVSKADGRTYLEIYERDIKPVLAGKDTANLTPKESASVVVPGREPPAPDPYAEVFKRFQVGKASLMDVLKAKGLRFANR